MQQTVMAVTRGIDLDLMDVSKYKNQIERDAMVEFEKTIKEKVTGDGKDLCIKAYEDILLHKRKQEMAKLNMFRFKEIEKNRPPEDGWYMKTTTDFRDELYRNRVSLKPNDTNKNYLNTLKDPFLY